MNGPMSEAHANLQNSIDNGTLNAPAAGDQAPPANEPSKAASDSDSGDESSAPTLEDILDLDSAQKFRFQGQDWTPEELQAAILRQKDYTKKTTELATERKFYKNLDADLRSVKQDPSLAERFKEIYPERFHAFLDVVLEQRKEQAEGESEGKSAVPDAYEQRLRAIEERYSKADAQAHEAQVENHLQQINQLFDKFSAKYEFGVEAAVLTKAEALIAKGYKMTPAAWERLWKADHETNLKKVEQWHDKRVKDQLNKNKEGGDIGRGGGTPSRGQKRMSFDEATEAAIASLKK